MRSCLGILVAFGLLISLAGGIALIWYLNYYTEFSRAPVEATAPVPAPVPKPAPPRPPAVR